MKTLHTSVLAVDATSIAPAQRAVALVEVVHECDRNGDDTGLGARMTAVLETFGEHDVVLTGADVTELAIVCRLLREVLVAPDRDRAAGRLNALLVAYAGPPRLVHHDGWDWHLHVDASDDAPWAEWLASSAALSLATMLVAAPGVPWGECAADSCARVYVHDGRGGERHYCSTTCATRERVRRHRATTRANQPADHDSGSAAG